MQYLEVVLHERQRVVSHLGLELVVEILVHVLFQQ